MVKQHTLIVFITFALAAAVLLPVHAQETTIETFTLKHRTPQEIIPVIRPLAGVRGAVTGMNDQLIVRATPERLAQIKRLLRRIDVPPLRLMITVKQDAENAGADRGAQLYGRAGSNAAQLNARLYSTQSQRGGAYTQQVQALSGSPAYIQIGRAIPIMQQVITPAGQVINSIDYHNVSVGFYVLPRVSGNQVTLRISPRRDELSENGGEIAIQRVQTTVSGRLGEWIDIGGAVQQIQRQSNGIGYATSAYGSEQRRVLVKVDVLK